MARPNTTPETRSVRLLKVGEQVRHVLTELLTGLDVGRCDIAGCCQFGGKGYRRNTIARSDWYELLALCWRSGDCINPC